MQVSASETTARILNSMEASAKTQAQIGVAIAKKQLDADKQTGEAIVQMIQSAASTAGRGIDVKA